MTLLWALFMFFLSCAVVARESPTAYTYEGTVTPGSSATITFTGGKGLHLGSDQDAAMSVRDVSCNSFEGSRIGEYFGGLYQWTGGFLGPNNMIYGMPGGRGRVLKIDPATDAITLIGPDYGDYGALWYNGVMASNGTHMNIYGIPGKALQWLKIDPGTDSVGLVGPVLDGNYKWKGGALAPNGMIYAMPSRASQVRLRVRVRVTVMSCGSVFCHANVCRIQLATWKYELDPL